MIVFMAHATGRLLGRLHILVVVMFLTSCAVLGPEYTEPKVDWLDDWQSDLYGQIGSSETQASLDLQFWWQLFDDEVLNQLIDIAKNENPSIRIAGLRRIRRRMILETAYIKTSLGTACIAGDHNGLQSFAVKEKGIRF